MMIECLVERWNGEGKKRERRCERTEETAETKEFGQRNASK